jgi:hypothetical protein
MNTKIIVALVIGVALVGLTGAAVAASYDSNGNWIRSSTDITGTHVSSSSQTRVSGTQTSYTRESLLVAELVYPTYPEVDMAWSATQIKGSNYGVSTSTRSRPTGSRDEYEIENPSVVEGYTAFFNCAMWGVGVPQQVIPLPTDENEPLYVEWFSYHGAGGAYPASLSQSHNIYWP